MTHDTPAADTEFAPDYSDIEREPDDGIAPFVLAYDSLAEAVLLDAIPPELMRRIEGDEPLAVVVAVPSQDWVGPIETALTSLREWHDVTVSNSTTRKRPSNDTAARKLARGLSVAGVAVAPERQLPTALLTAADARIVIQTPDSRTLARVIAMATGEAPGAMPLGIGSGLDFFDLVAAIRVGSTAAECVRRLQSAAGSLTVVDPLVADVPRLEEMHGFGAAAEFGLRLVRELQEFRNGTLPFEAIDRHVVLASSPGLGKSTFVRSLAKSTGLPLIVTSVASWFTATDGYLNNVLKEVDRTFAAAAACAPSILFLDELDALPSRDTVGERNRDYWVPIITNILLTLDSATSGTSSRLIVIGATNYGDKLDPALVRPGRLNRIITIHPPEPADLAGIMRQHVGTDLPGEDLLPIAEIGRGATGAQVMGWVKRAKGMAREAGRAMIIDDLVGAVAPPDNTPEAERRRHAVHEAGHAVIAHRTTPGCVRAVSIVHRGDTAGSTVTRRVLGASPTRAEVELDVVATLAGRAAEVVIMGEASVGAGGGPDSDLGLATRQIAALLTSYGLGVNLIYLIESQNALELLRFDPELRATVSRTLAGLHERTVIAVRQHRAAIEAVADALMRRRHLSGDAFAEIVAAFDAKARPRKGPRHG
jgi:cell division protease FtsH